MATPKLSARALAFAFAVELVIVLGVFALAWANRISGERALVAVGFIVVGRLRPPPSSPGGGAPAGIVAMVIAGAIATGRALVHLARGPAEQPAGGE